MRLRRLLRALDVALFATGVVALLLWGWPESAWGWAGLQGALVPLPASLAYGWWRARRDAQLVQRMREERRRKFGGFVSVPGQQKPAKVERPK